MLETDSSCIKHLELDSQLPRSMGTSECADQVLLEAQQNWRFPVTSISCSFLQYIIHSNVRTF